MVANPSLATVLGQLLIVDREHDVQFDPDGVRYGWSPHAYFASSRSTARRFFMILRAAVICDSNSGLYGVSR